MLKNWGKHILHLFTCVKNILIFVSKVAHSIISFHFISACRLSKNKKKPTGKGTRQKRIKEPFWQGNPRKTRSTLTC